MMAPRVLAIVQARMSSRRLPAKVLADVEGAPVLMRQIERIRRSRLIDELVVATSSDATDDPLADALDAARIPIFRGALDDVLSRYATVTEHIDPQHVVRLTGDCPLADPDVIDVVIAHHLVAAADITSNTVVPTFPDGLDVEIVKASVLLAAAKEAQLAFEREHVTQFVYRRPERFRIENYALAADLSHLRWTLDEPEDLAFIRRVYHALLPKSPRFGFRDVLALLDAQPELKTINIRFERNEGLKRSLAADGLKPDGCPA
jgi:spore coat polysaccharide biosynthesis protein SpsF